MLSVEAVEQKSPEAQDRAIYSGNEGSALDLFSVGAGNTLP